MKISLRITILGHALSPISTGERLLGYGDLNGHRRADVDGFESMHGGFGLGSHNVEGEMLLELCDSMSRAVANTFNVML